MKSKLIFFICLITLNSCSKQDSVGSFMPYYFTIVNSAANSFFDQKPDLKIYTIEDNQKIYLTPFYTYEFQEASLGSKYKYYWAIQYLSSTTIKKNYFIEISGGDIDTLYLDIRANFNNHGNVYDEKFNDKPVLVDDQSIQNARLHLLEK